MTNIPTITTDRLTLRPFVEEDVEPLYRFFSDSDVMRYFPNPNPLPRERVQKIIVAQLEHWEKHDCGWWAVELRPQNECIGWSGLQFLPETDEIEIAYMLGRPFWGKGLATESARAGLRYGFETLNLPFIVGIVHLENVASQRVIEKLKMPFVEQTQYFGMDCYRYLMEAATYFANQEM